MRDSESFGGPFLTLLTFPINAGSQDLPIIREQDRLLPIANVSKIMKKAIPDNGKMAKDSKECMQVCMGCAFGSCGILSRSVSMNVEQFCAKFCFVEIQAVDQGCATNGV
jgi:hypothetical protein